MQNLTRHILLPTLAPLLFFVVAATPVEFLGCRNRGLLALTIAFASVLCALYAAIRGANCSHRRDPQSTWWLLSLLILAIPPVALLVLA
jgi:hypothetical protein